MSIELGPVTVAVGPLQEWQQLSRTAISQAVGQYLHGCADLAMARTPEQALAALHRMQTDVLRRSTDTFAEAARLWHKQNADPHILQAERTRVPTQPAAKSRTMRSS